MHANNRLASITRPMKEGEEKEEGREEGREKRRKEGGGSKSRIAQKLLREEDQRVGTSPSKYLGISD